MSELDKYYQTNIQSSYDKYYPTEIITSSYYPDMTQPPIGKRPVYVSRDEEYKFPKILTTNKHSVNLASKCFSCHQPCWDTHCM